MLRPAPYIGDGIREVARPNGRERWPGLTVVLTSGYSHVLAEEGSHGFQLLKKPYSINGLLQALQPAAETQI